jgi:hypothetical protein
VSGVILTESQLLDLVLILNNLPTLSYAVSLSLKTLWLLYVPLALTTSDSILPAERVSYDSYNKLGLYP